MQDQKSFGAKIFLCPKHYELKFSVNKNLDPEKFWVQKKLGPKQFLVHKILGPQNFGSKKIQGRKKIEGLQKLRSKKYWSKKCLIKKNQSLP